MNQNQNQIQKSSSIDKEITEVEAKRAFELGQELRQLVASATEHFFRMGEIMKEIRDNELWRTGYESFTAYFSDPELGFKKSSVYHAMRLVELFDDRKAITDVPVSKLIMIAPHVTKENRDDLISQARALSQSDLHHQLTLMRVATVEPRIATIPKIYPCAVCFKAKGIDFDAICHCGWTKEHIEYVSDIINKIQFDGVIPSRKDENDEGESNDY